MVVAQEVAHFIGDQTVLSLIPMGSWAFFSSSLSQSEVCP